MAMTEERTKALEQNVRNRAKEKKISHFDAVKELLTETFDNDEEELLQCWWFQLHPRKHPRNPFERMARYFANERPGLGFGVLLLLGAYPTGVVYLLTHGHVLLGLALAAPLLLWYAGNYQMFIHIYRCFLPMKEQINRQMNDLRPRFVEDCRILGDDPVEAELNASERLEFFRSIMLEGAEKFESRGSRVMLFVALGATVALGAYLVATLFLK